MFVKFPLIEMLTHLKIQLGDTEEVSIDVRNKTILNEAVVKVVDKTLDIAVVDEFCPYVENQCSRFV